MANDLINLPMIDFTLLDLVALECVNNIFYNYYNELINPTTYDSVEK